MITLPPIEKSSLRSFVVIVGVWGGASLAALAWLLGIWRFLTMGALISIIWVACALLAPGVARFSYRAWNRAAVEFAGAARAVITGICFYVVMVAVGRTESVFPLRSPKSGESMWVPRTALAGAHGAQTVSAQEDQARSWFSSYTSWALNSGNHWCIVLLPFLIILSALDTPREEFLPTDTYTLY